MCAMSDMQNLQSAVSRHRPAPSRRERCVPDFLGLSCEQYPCCESLQVTNLGSVCSLVLFHIFVDICDAERPPQSMSFAELRPALS